MSIRKVMRMGHPVLREKARDLTREEIASPEFKDLIEDMIETMHDYGGIGLAAPQIGESVAVAIVDYQEENSRYADQTKGAVDTMPFTVIVNPRVKVLDETEQSFWEGCLSVPDLRGLVSRPRKIQVQYLDITGKSKSVVVEGFLATVFQHEIDHLNGIIYVDRVKTEPGKTNLSFGEEYTKFLAPKDGDDVGELPE